MSKKKARAEYNDFLDGEKLRDNTEVRSSLSGALSTAKISPAPTRREEQGKTQAAGKKPNRPQLTHFLCLPLVNSGSISQFEQSLDGFRKELGKDDTVPLNAVRPLGTLHLTLGVMALDAKGLEEAGKCLEELDWRRLMRHALSSPSSTQGGTSSPSDPLPTSGKDIKPLSIDLKSLVPMQSQNVVSILYAEPVDGTSHLYAFASALRDRFAKRGLMVDDNRPLKLHATIVNTIYAKPKGRPMRTRPQAEASTGARSSQERQGAAAPAKKAQDRSKGHGPNAKSQIKFDARELVAQYKDFVWAENVTIEKVQICKMGAKKTFNEAGDVVAEEYEEVFGKRIDN